MFSLEDKTTLVFIFSLKDVFVIFLRNMFGYHESKEKGKYGDREVISSKAVPFIFQPQMGRISLVLSHHSTLEVNPNTRI